MRDRLQAHPGSWLAVAVLASLLQVSCQTSWSQIMDMDGPDRGTDRGTAANLPLGSWTRDSLHCDAGLCERFYDIEVDEPGLLRVDLYAPVGDGLPDCELSLETEDGETLEARTGRVQTQRRLRYETDAPGTYRLHLASTGDSSERFDFEVVADLSEPKKRQRVPIEEPTAPSRRAPQPPPDIPVAKLPPDRPREPSRPERPPPRPIAVPVERPAAPKVAERSWVVAEVLDVEETGGRPTAVMLEAGIPDGVGPGMQGELVEGDTVIGRIKVLDVYPTGSRAKILGELSAPVSFDTSARIEVPLGPGDSRTTGE